MTPPHLFNTVLPSRSPLDRHHAESWTGIRRNGGPTCADYAPWREQGFIAWVGLRGSVPMMLATLPVLAGLPQSHHFFDIAFFIVLVSLIVQGWTVGAAAKLLGLLMPPTNTRVRRIEVDLPGSSGFEIVSYKVGASSGLIGSRPKHLPIADASRVVSLSRGGRLLPYRDWGTLQAGDYISLLATQGELPGFDELFQSRRPKVESAHQRYFGEFVIAPTAPLQALTEAYGISLPEGMPGRMTVREYCATALPRAVVGDKIALGAVELVVRRMDGKRIVEVGLRLPHG